MQHIFWFVEGKVAGRSGPSKHPWDLSELRAAGIGAVLSVNGGDACEPDEFVRAGLQYQCCPLSPNAPPIKGDLEHCLQTLPIAMRYLLSNERAGLPTLIHCHSGKDRTGLLMAYYATKSMHLGAAEAIDLVRAVRPIAFTAPGWDDFALRVLKASGA